MNNVHRPWVPKAKPWNIQRHDDAFYQTKEYKLDRANFLKANPYCVECLKKNRYEKAIYNDHITPISQGGDPWDWANRQGLCRKHNAAKTSRDRKSKTK